MKILFLILFFCFNLFSYSGDGVPLKYISSCEIDLNQDNQGDIVFLVETLRGRELIALMKNNKGYKAFLVSQSPKGNGLHMGCHQGYEVKEWAGKSQAKKIKVPGAYISYFKPESASVAYYWNGKNFSEVVTGD